MSVSDGARGLGPYAGGDVPQRFDNPGHLIIVARAGEQRQSKKQLCTYAAERPHVDGSRVLQAEEDLWRAIEAGLDQGRQFLVFKAGRAEVCDLDVGRFEPEIPTAAGSVSQIFYSQTEKSA